MTSATLVSKESAKTYTLTFDGNRITCTCPDFHFRRSDWAREHNAYKFLGGTCKHARQWIAELEAEVSAARATRSTE